LHTLLKLHRVICRNNQYMPRTTAQITFSFPPVLVM
jgi:hypothetical protein